MRRGWVLLVLVGCSETQHAFDQRLCSNPPHTQCVYANAAGTLLTCCK